MIELDMRRDLAKVSRETTSQPGRMATCTYTGPCAIGAMMTPKDRRRLARLGYDSKRIGSLIAGRYDVTKAISVPDDQIDDFEALQRAFDRNADRFDAKLAELKEKYDVR
jgi:hypothetical protein